MLGGQLATKRDSELNTSAPYLRVRRPRLAMVPHVQQYLRVRQSPQEFQLESAMDQQANGRRARRGLVQGLFALVGLLAGLIVLAPNAVAVTTCLQGDGAMVVHVDEDDPSAETLIQVRSGRLFVNGELCGTGVDGSITIIDTGEPKVDRIKIDLGAGLFRMNGQAVFVNLILNENGPNGGRDEVRIRATSSADVVQVRPDFIFVDGTTPDSRKLLMGIDGSDAKFYFTLRAGPDNFQMGRDAAGASYRGFMSVKGGAGRDELIGGPGRQRLRGGKGADIIEGKAGADLLWGNSGADFITGGKGADVISGGKGVDDVRGGPGADILNMRDGRADDVGGQRGRDVCDCDASDNVSSARRL